jgi:hypothetical protein
MLLSGLTAAGKPPLSLISAVDQLYRGDQSSGDVLQVLIAPATSVRLRRCPNARRDANASTQILSLTMDHRIDTNLREQQRVTASGGLITNVDRSGERRLALSLLYAYVQGLRSLGKSCA